jgi:RNA recognition motif-containing protein
MATNGSLEGGAAAAKAPAGLRMILLNGNNETEAAQKKSFMEQLTKDKTDLFAKTVRFDQTHRELRRGRVVIAETKNFSEAIKIFNSNSRRGANFLGALVKFGAGADAGEDDISVFSKQYTIKNDGDIPSVVAQIKEELFGKNSPPIVVKPSAPPKIVRGQFTGGDLSADDLRKAFEAFGKVEDFQSTSATSCLVTFEDASSGAKAVEKAEISVNGVAVKVTRGRVNTPRRPLNGDGQQRAQKSNAPKKASSGGANGNSKGSASVFLKIENVPDELDLQSLKQTFQGYDEKMVVDLNTQKHHVILKTSSSDVAQKIAKSKIVVKGVELKPQPYTPRVSGTKNRKSQAASGDVKSAPAGFKIVVEGADREKCTKEQLEKLFGGFKGLTSISRTRDQRLVFVAYDNAEATQEILSAKEISCAGCKLSIRPFEQRGPSEQRARGAPAPNAATKAPASTGAAGGNKKRENNRRESAPRAPRENTLIIRDLPADIDVADLAPLFQSFDAAVNVRVNKRISTAFIEFSSPETCKQALAKETKYGNQVLKKEASSKPVDIPVGVYIKGVRPEQEAQLKEALKPMVGEPTVIVFTKLGARVGLKSPKDAETAIALKLNLGGSPLTVEALRTSN